jgi:lysophospholipase L1-like esterase
LLVGLASAMTASTASTASTSTASASVLVVGDSLGVGTEPSLRAALPTLAIDADSRNGRTSPEGLAALREQLRPQHETVVFDLGTNDGPTAVGLTAGSLVAARELAAGRCLVVATLNHPPRAGVSIDAQNASIRRFVAEAPGAALVDWHAAAHATRGALRPDGVHATSAGYALRGQLFAEAVQSCLTGGLSGGAGRSTAAPPGHRASATKRPARRRRSDEPQDPPLGERLLEAVTEPLTHEGGPLDLAAKAGATILTAAATLRASLTPRGPEPVLGAPD